MQRRLKIILLLVAPLVVAGVAQVLILGGKPFIALRPTDTSLSGAVSQNLAAASGKDFLPIEGRDYVVEDAQSFSNREWFVVKVGLTANDTKNNAYIILKSAGAGAYQAVLGPGTSFSQTYAPSMPIDVANYLNDRGVFYEPVN
jgi:hypothetical protein